MNKGIQDVHNVCSVFFKANHEQLVDFALDYSYMVNSTISVADEAANYLKVPNDKAQSEMPEAMDTTSDATKKKEVSNEMHSDILADLHVPEGMVENLLIF